MTQLVSTAQNWMLRHVQANQGKDSFWAELFRTALHRLPAASPMLFLSPDELGRNPIHWCSMYGTVQIAEYILALLTASEPDSQRIWQLITTQDKNGRAPLDYTVIYNRPEMAKILLNVKARDIVKTGEYKPMYSKHNLDLLLLFAIKYQHDAMVEILASTGLHSNDKQDQRQTAFYVAAQIGRLEYTSTLLQACTSSRSFIDISEPVNGWTPLFIACVYGHASVVKALLQAGASQTKRDCWGWTALDHAVLRGHMSIADQFEARNLRSLVDSMAISEVIETKGRDLETLESSLILNLGSMQGGIEAKGVDLKASTQLDKFERPSYVETLVLVIAILEGTEPFSIDVPISTDTVVDSFVFPVQDHQTVTVSFTIYSREQSSRGPISALVGNGIAILGSHDSPLWRGRDPLVRSMGVPILEKESMKLLGTVNFTYVIARPFEFEDLSVNVRAENQILKGGKVELIGHRGLGQNTSSREYLQIGENTVGSFLSAARLGASYVEFDVQVTRDLIPIIYHDFSLSESGTDIPIHDLTLEQVSSWESVFSRFRANRSVYALQFVADKEQPHEPKPSRF